MQIFVGSHNPVKINAVINAAIETWPDVLVEGFDVSSNVPEQPLGDEQTKLGAKNRALGALDAGISKSKTSSKTEMLGVGLEGGVYKNDKNELWSTVWVSVVDRAGNHFEANGGRFLVPKLVAKKILSGGEMGPIISQIAGVPDVRKKQGMIGVITGGFVERTEIYTTIAKMALGLWYGRNWDKELDKEITST